MSKAAAKEMADMDAEHDLHVLQRAREIQSDKSRLSAAKRVARKKMTSLRSISGRR